MSVPTNATHAETAIKRPHGRPRGTTKPEDRRRRRVDFRLAPATLEQLEQARHLLRESHTSAPNAPGTIPETVPATRTALVEAAIACYLQVLKGQLVPAADELAKMVEIERLRTRVADLESELALARTRAEPAQKREEAKASSLRAPAPSRSRLPVYEIWIRHAPGPCPALPTGFRYLDTASGLHPSESESRQCPRHRVFAQSLPIAQVRERLNRLKDVPGVCRVWLAKNGYALDTDRWIWDQEKKRWVPDW